MDEHDPTGNWLAPEGPNQVKGVSLFPWSGTHWDKGEKAVQFNGVFRGRSSVVERQLPKLNVVGSIPIARSKFLFAINGLTAYR